MDDKYREEDNIYQRIYFTENKVQNTGFYIYIYIYRIKQGIHKVSSGTANIYETFINVQITTKLILAQNQMYGHLMRNELTVNGWLTYLTSLSCTCVI